MREEKTKYYVIKEKAVPEVLLKVIEAKRLMDMQELTVQQATEKAGISRSSFYKFRCAEDYRRVSRKYSDHSSDDSVKRRGVTDDQCGYRGRPGRRHGDDQRD